MSERRQGPDDRTGRSQDDNDHFIKRDGKCFAGIHMIADFWGASRLDDIRHIDATLRQAVASAGASLLYIYIHHFTENGGVSGIAVLAESHMSIHSWPERDYAALDIFMCGDSDPYKAIDVLREAFIPDCVNVDVHFRGEVEADEVGDAPNDADEAGGRSIVCSRRGDDRSNGQSSRRDAGWDAGESR